MDSDQLRQFNSLVRSLVFLKGAKYQTPRLVVRREKLEKAIARVEALWDTQRRNSDNRDTVKAKALRKDLWTHHLKPINKDAKTLLDGIPGVSDMFKMPKTRAAGSELIDAALRIVNNAKPFEAIFIEEGRYRPDFIARAEKVIDALAAHLKEPDTTINRRSYATASLQKELAKGREILNSIDGIIDDEFADDKGARDLWKKARQLGGKIGRPKNNWRPPPKPLPRPPEPPQDEE